MNDRRRKAGALPLALTITLVSITVVSLSLITVNFNGGVIIAPFSNIRIVNGVVEGPDNLAGKAGGPRFVQDSPSRYDEAELRSSAAPGFIVSVYGRKAGERQWRQTFQAEKGDVVEIAAEYLNTSGQTSSHVMAKYILPKSFSYIPGSTKLYNGNHQLGAYVVEDSVVENGINIGRYENGANCFVKIRATVNEQVEFNGNFDAFTWCQYGVGKEVVQNYACAEVAG